MGTMANDAIDSQPAGTWPELKSGPLVAGGVLIGIGAMVALAGLAVAGSHVIAATRRWTQELEIAPSELARLRWEQAKFAAATGASAWREHPNAKVRLARRAGAVGSG
jgi:hypothetical protein